MAKKQKAAPKPTPGKKAYLVLLESLQAKYQEFAEGNAEDNDFTTPGKQKKVAKQIAKLHNRFIKKVPEFGIEELDEDPE
jgi:hypothetical protein